LRSGAHLNRIRPTKVVVNFTLQVGQVAEKVEVTAQAPLVDTTTSSVGGIIETSQIVNFSS